LERRVDICSGGAGGVAELDFFGSALACPGGGGGKVPEEEDSGLFVVELRSVLLLLLLLLLLELLLLMLELLLPLRFSSAFPKTWRVCSTRNNLISSESLLIVIADGGRDDVVGLT